MKKKTIIIITVIAAIFALIVFAAYRAVNKAFETFNAIMTEDASAPKRPSVVTGTERYVFDGKYYEVPKIEEDTGFDDKESKEYAQYLNDMIEIKGQEAAKLEQYIPEEHKNFAPTTEESGKNLNKTAKKAKEFLNNDYTAIAKYYGDLAYAEKGLTQEARLRKEAYRAQREYYMAKANKIIVLKTLNMNLPMMDAARKALMASSAKDPDFIKWQEKIIVPEIKIIKMEPSGYLVPDIIYDNLEQIGQKKINPGTKKAAKNTVPEITYIEYYTTKGDIAQNFGFELFYFEFNAEFNLSSQQSLYLETAVMEILKQRQDVASCGWERKPENDFPGIAESNKEQLTYNGKSNSGTDWQATGSALAKGNKAWVFLTRSVADTTEALPEEKTITSWYKAENSNIKINIEGIERR